MNGEEHYRVGFEPENTGRISVSEAYLHNYRRWLSESERISGDYSWLNEISKGDLSSDR